MNAWQTLPAWQLAGWTMLHFLWLGAGLGLVAWSGRWALRGARPEVRYAYALACLSVLAAAPVVIAWTLRDRTPEPTSPGPLGSFEALPGVALSAPSFDPIEPALAVVPAFTNAPPPEASTDRLARLVAWLPWVWLGGAPLTFAWLAWGLAGAERLRRSGRPVDDPAWLARLRALADDLGVRGRVALAVSNRVATPTLVGLVRPWVLLPPAALTGWPPEVVEMALLHELAHIRRRDNLVNLAQRVVESALFFHPAVWVVSGWVRVEREHCCDRAVVAQTGRPRAYAEALATLAQTGGWPAGRVGLAMAEHPVVGRIRRILIPEERAMKLPWGVVIVPAALLLAPAVWIGLRAQQPESDAPPGEADAGRAELTPETTDLLRKAWRDAEVHGSLEVRAHRLAEVAAAQARLGDRDAARRSFTEAVELASTLGGSEGTGPHPLISVGQIQAESGFRDDARETLRRAYRIFEVEVDGGAVPDGRILMDLPNLAKQQAAIGDREASRATYELGRRLVSAPNPGGTRYFPPGPEWLINLRADSGDVAGAWEMALDPELFREFPPERAADSRHQVRMWIVLNLRPSDAPAAGPILEAARRIVEDHAKAQPNASRATAERLGGLQTLARAQIATGFLDEAERTIGELNADDPAHRDSASFGKAWLLSEIGQRKARSGDRDGARRLSREVVRLAESIEAPQSRSIANEHATRLLIAVGDFDEAARVTLARQNPFGFVVYLDVAAARRAAGDEEGARGDLRDALRLARERLEAPGEGPLSQEVDFQYQMHVVLARIHDALGEHDAASQWMGKIQGPQRTDGWEQIATARAAGGDPTGALDALEQIPNVPLRSLAFLRVVGALGRPEPDPF